MTRDYSTKDIDLVVPGLYERESVFTTHIVCKCEPLQDHNNHW